MSIKEGKPGTSISDLLLMITLCAPKYEKTATVVVFDSITASFLLDSITTMFFLVMNLLELEIGDGTLYPIQQGRSHILSLGVQ